MAHVVGLYGIEDGAPDPQCRPIATDREVMRYITGGIPWSDEQVRAIVGRQVDLYRDRGLCRWKLVGVAMPENRASTRIMEKLGFEFESEFENEGVRLVQYAIDRERHASEAS